MVNIIKEINPIVENKYYAMALAEGGQTRYIVSLLSPTKFSVCNELWKHMKALV